MKIILSRKGFDSVAGGCPSPIFEDGSQFSLPILQPWPLPEPGKETTFSDINFKYPIGKVVEDLTRHRVTANSVIHLDPDLRKDSLPRKENWRPLFGQCHAAQTHLNENRVGVGDIFLFFGWFRQVEEYQGVFRFKPKAPNQHILFGWLEIGEIWRAGESRSNLPDWAERHPHVTTEFTASNTIYVAGDDPHSAGAFQKARDDLTLTCPGENRSLWRLPRWFDPTGKKSCLSYHSSPARWRKEGEYTYLSSVARGQEFVLDCDDYLEAEVWVRQLITNNV